MKADTNSCRYEFGPVSCKYPLNSGDIRVGHSSELHDELWPSVSKYDAKESQQEASCIDFKLSH